MRLVETAAPEDYLAPAELIDSDASEIESFVRERLCGCDGAEFRPHGVINGSRCSMMLAATMPFMHEMPCFSKTLGTASVVAEINPGGCGGVLADREAPRLPS